ncbi:MAG: FixH family protein [Gammaproteobacteria bacterium]
MNNSVQAETTAIKPWYRRLRPWFIMAPLAATIIAGIITIYPPFSNHQLVADDNDSIDESTARRLQQEQTAAEMHLQAEVKLTRDSTGSFFLKVRLYKTNTTTELPQTLRATLIHSSKPELNRDAELIQSDGLYQGPIDIPASNYHLQLEDPERTWSLIRKLPVGLGSFTIDSQDETA